MEETSSCCFGCLATEEEFSLEEFPIQCEPLKAIFQGDTIKLCYICNRLAQHTELFIQNVQSNQIYLENFQGALSSSIQTIREQVQSSITLSQTPLISIDLNGTVEDDEELYTIVGNNELTKLEPKLEGLEHLVGELIEDLQESLLKANLQESLPKADLQESLPKADSQESLPIADLQESLPIADLQESLPIADLQESLLKADLQESLLKADLQVSLPKADLQESKSKVDLQESLPKADLQESISKADLQESLPIADLQESLPIADLQESLPKADLQESLLKAEEEDDIPLNLFLKREIELDNIDLKSLRKVMKSHKVKGIKKKERTKKKEIKIKEQDIPKIYIKMHLNEKQMKNENENRAQTMSYKSSTYKCEICVKGFLIRSSYEKHLKKHRMSSGKFCCPVCTMRYDTAGKLETHKLNHTLRYQCINCEYVCSNHTTIKEHFAAKHSIVGYFELKCPHCPKVFTRAESLRKHRLYNHSGHGKVICEACNKSYATKGSLKEHIIRKHMADSCESLEKHFVCHECGMAFKAPSHLRNHATKHSEVKPFYCVECDRSFKTAASLSLHFKTTSTHVTPSDLPLQCQHCDKRFAIKRDVIRHTNRVHLNIKPYSCDKCERTYINNWSLKQHMRFTHDGAKRPLRFPCTMCEKIFDRNSIRKSHMRTHTGERPYQCRQCSATFAQGSALGTHVKLIHLRLTRDGKPKPTALK